MGRGWCWGQWGGFGQASGGWGSGNGGQVEGLLVWVWAPVPLPSGTGSLTVWCRSGMPILKTIMLKWASSGTDMERPCRPRTEAKLPGAPLPRPRVPRRPLPGPSGELSDSEPPSGHSLALWRSSSSLEAGLCVIVGPRGDGGRQHHRQLLGPRGAVRPGTPTSQGTSGQGQPPRTARGRQAGGWTHPPTLLLPWHTPLCLPPCRTRLLPCPWPCSQPPPLLRPTLPLTQHDGVPETAESPRELLAHFARPGKMQLKLAEDTQVDDPPAPCPPDPGLAPHPSSSHPPPEWGGRGGDIVRGRGRCSDPGAAGAGSLVVLSGWSR